MSTPSPTPRLRVVLAARDRRFLRVADFLLSRSGFFVEVASETSDLLRAVALHEPDVVVVDGSDSFPDAGRTVRAIEVLHPRVGIVVVAEEWQRTPRSRRRTLPKWGSLERLTTVLDDVAARAAA